MAYCWLRATQSANNLWIFCFGISEFRIRRSDESAFRLFAIFDYMHTARSQFVYINSVRDWTSRMEVFASTLYWKLCRSRHHRLKNGACENNMDKNAVERCTSKRIREINFACLSLFTSRLMVFTKNVNVVYFVCILYCLATNRCVV